MSYDDEMTTPHEAMPKYHEAVGASGSKPKTMDGLGDASIPRHVVIEQDELRTALASMAKASRAIVKAIDARLDADRLASRSNEGQNEGRIDPPVQADPPPPSEIFLRGGAGAEPPLSKSEVPKNIIDNQESLWRPKGCPRGTEPFHLRGVGFLFIGKAVDDGGWFVWYLDGTRSELLATWVSSPEYEPLTGVGRLMMEEIAGGCADSG